MIRELNHTIFFVVAQNEIPTHCSPYFIDFAELLYHCHLSNSSRQAIIDVVGPKNDGENIQPYLMEDCPQFYESK